MLAQSSERKRSAPLFCFLLAPRSSLGPSGSLRLCQLPEMRSEKPRIVGDRERLGLRPSLASSLAVPLASSQARSGKATCFRKCYHRGAFRSAASFVGGVASGSPPSCRGQRTCVWARAARRRSLREPGRPEKPPCPLFGRHRISGTLAFGWRFSGTASFSGPTLGAFYARRFAPALSFYHLFFIEIHRYNGVSLYKAPFLTFRANC